MSRLLYERNKENISKLGYILVDKLSFCGAFTVNGNIYVNRQSSFGPLPKGTKINGQIIL